MLLNWLSPNTLMMTWDDGGFRYHQIAVYAADGSKTLGTPVREAR